MYRFNLPSFVLLVLVCTAALTAEEYTPADFGVSVDYSRFAVEGGVYLDIYLLVPRGAFEYREVDGQYEASVLFQTALLQGDEVPYGPDRWMRTFTVDDPNQLGAQQRIPDISKYYALPGDYTLLVDVVEVDSRKRQRIELDLKLELFPDELALSDITVASLIAKAAKENEFTRYGYDIVPNAELTFGTNAPMCYYFFEVYNLSGKGEYTIATQVKSLSGEIVQDFGTTRKAMPGTSAVEWGGVNTGGLKAGIYILNMNIKDESANAVAKREKRFYIYRENEQKDDGPLENEYSGLNDEQLGEIYQLVSMIMNPEEDRLFSNSDTEGKQRILTTVFQRRDPDPTTVENEYKDAFYQRVQIANADYSMRTTKGWATDRGRVLIVYGKPDNIEQVASAINERPWERWEYYSLEGGVEFIFVDKSGFGDYELVHSTAQNETYDPGWQRWLH